MADRFCHCRPWFSVGRTFAALVLSVCLAAGCNPTASGPSGSNPDDPMVDDGTTPDDGSTPVTGAIDFEGVVSGSVAESRSTRDSAGAGSGGAGQDLPDDFDPERASVAFEDLSGQPLLDAEGEPYVAGEVSASGRFSTNGLPVGVDFVIAVDLEGDGQTDMEHFVQIPADQDGRGGRAEGVVIDPLTSLAVAKLKDLLADRASRREELGVSPTTVVHRIVDAFTHLFEESGIDSIVTVEDIAGLDGADRQELFDEIVPPTVRTGMETVGGALALGQTENRDEGVRAAAEVFLRAGFPIADAPGGIDLSFLADLPDVDTLPIDEFRSAQDVLADVPTGEDDLLADGSLDPSLFEGGTLDRDFIDDFLGGGSTSGAPQFLPGAGGPRPTIYVSLITEPDRNFSSQDDSGQERKHRRLPVINEGLLRRMAALHLENRIITLGNLYRLLIDPRNGLGVRLTYKLPGAAPGAPHRLVFETTNGRGVTRDFGPLFSGLLGDGAIDPGAAFDELAANHDSIRQRLRDFLEGTIAPSFDRLLGVLRSERIENAEQLFSLIRETRAHLPFSRSGPATFFVVADGDAFDAETVGTVHAVTVDVEFDATGQPVHVAYNASGSGAYYLGFTRQTNQDHRVELLIRETGRRLHGHKGEPLFLDMNDDSKFSAVGGGSFLDFVTKSGSFYPGLPVRVPNPAFRVDGEGRNDESRATIQLFVLATGFGEEAMPVKIDFSAADGTYTYNVNGRYYLTFTESSQRDGVFGLFDLNLSRPATTADLAAVEAVTTGMEAPDHDAPPLGGFVRPPNAGPPATVSISAIVGLEVDTEASTLVYGTEVPNEHYDPAGDPYFDDANNNGIEDVGELTVSFRPILFNRGDWRSTDVARYYRRVSGDAVTAADVDFAADQPQAQDGEALVARRLLPRLNAFRFGRPNTAINLLTAFLPPSFFDGTHAIDEDTPLGIFQAIATINLVMEQVLNVEAEVDVDGDGPLQSRTILVDARLFIVPIGDPFVLLVEGFESLATLPRE